MFNNRPESLMLTLRAIGEFVLMLCGIIGIAVQVFRDQGLLRLLLEKLMAATAAGSIGIILASLVFIGLAAAGYRRLFSRTGNSRALGNFMMKAMMVIGAGFLYLFITTGSFRL